jgi:hypothetical protein
MTPQLINHNNKVIIAMKLQSFLIKGCTVGIVCLFMSTSIASSTENIRIITEQLKSAELTKYSVTSQVPTSFDWRNVDGVDYTTSVKNQAPAPTCEAYGLCAAVETIVQYTVGHPFNCDLSEAHLFFYAGGSVERGGVRLSSAADYLISHGVPDEGCFPDTHRPFDGPFESVAGWENRTVKITSWGWVDKNETAIKQALVTYGPLVICIYSRSNLLRYRQGIYMPEGSINGGHVVALVGYDDAQRCWIIKNSAGADWGENGYIRVSYDANTIDHPFFADFYGGTGIMYVDGVNGNFIPDVPQISIIQPDFFHTYVFGFDIPTLVRKGSIIQKGAPRILGEITVDVTTTNTEKIEFYVDGVLVSTDIEAPFSWDLETTRGLHTIETFGYHNDTLSKDIVDVYVII